MSDNAWRRTESAPDAQTLNALLNRLATGALKDGDIDLLCSAVRNNQVQVGGDVNDSVIVTGDRTTVINGADASSLTAALREIRHGFEIHHDVPIPEPPIPFVAHPYSLLQTTTGIVGRVSEKKQLNVWLGGVTEQVRGRPLLALVAVGGMGKSALTWDWFRSLDPHAFNLEGMVWWSFYESNATYENFLARTTAYVLKRPLQHFADTPFRDLELTLYSTISERRFLFVLDGVERLLHAYATDDAAHALDSEDDFARELRLATDFSVGRFMRQLATVKSSKILMSTRLFPADIEINGLPIQGTARSDLGGLSDNEALEFWTSLGARGSHDELLEVFATFERHPLLIQSLAKSVCKDRNNPWRFRCLACKSPQLRSVLSRYDASQVTCDQNRRGGPQCRGTPRT